MPRMFSKDLPTEGNPVISSETVLRAVASFFSLKPAQLKAKNNSRPIAVPRQIAMYICKELTHQSLPQIGKRFRRQAPYDRSAFHANLKVDTTIRELGEFDQLLHTLGFAENGKQGTAAISGGAAWRSDVPWDSDGTGARSGCEGTHAGLGDRGEAGFGSGIGEDTCGLAVEMRSTRTTRG